MKKILILVLFAVTSVASATTIDFSSPRSQTGREARPYNVVNGDYGFIRKKGRMRIVNHHQKHGYSLLATRNNSKQAVFNLCLTEPGKAFDFLGFDSKSWHGRSGSDRNRKVDLKLEGIRSNGEVVTWNGTLTDNWSTKAFSEFTELSLVRFTLDASRGKTVGYFDNFNVQDSTSPVPVPGAVWLFATSLFGLVAKRRLV